MNIGPLRVLSLIALFCCGQSSALPAATPVRIDHIMIGTNDLASGIDEIERLTGVRPRFGGVHPGRGTRNALLSLGAHTYLELYAPKPGGITKSDDVRFLKGLHKLTPVGWAVSSNSAATLRKRAQSSGFELSKAEAGSRRLPDGAMLRWSTFGYATFDDPLAPFFIVWADPRLHPSRTSPGGCSLQNLRIADPAATELRRAIAPLQVNAEVRHATRRRMIVTLSCPRGEVTLG